MMRLPRTLAAAVAFATLSASVAPTWADEVTAEEIVTEETTTPPAETSTTETEAVTESPTAAGIGTDLLIGRPTLLMATIAGTAFYVISLPLTIPGGLEPDARERFLLPARQFVSTPLGGELTPTS